MTHTVLTQALALQRSAHQTQPVPDYTSRCADLKKLQQFLSEHSEAICTAISADYSHRSRHESLLFEIVHTKSAIDHALKYLKRWMRPQTRSVNRIAFSLASNRVVPQPLGVVGVISPWNFPINLSFGALTAIFAAGNRAMVKMSENSRHLTQLLIEKIPAYFPPEKLLFIDETGGVGAVFSGMPFDHLMFTGSSATGRLVMAAAARNLCPVTLELGGKSPALVLDDFDLRTAASRILYAKLVNAGQICTTVDHVYVPRAKVAAFVALCQTLAKARYPSLASSDYTAIIDDSAYTRLLQTLEQARATGAAVLNLIGGEMSHAGTRKIAPHVVVNPDPTSALMQQEIFGPILPIVPYDSVQEVVNAIKARPRPLAFYPFSNDQAQLHDLINKVMSGGVSINDALIHGGQHDLPFGGVGESGMGHYHGREGFETFSKMRPIFHQSRFAFTPLLFPPYGKTIDRVLRFFIR
jgi:coniferyl-aldehyde dehydrogenase